MIYIIDRIYMKGGIELVYLRVLFLDLRVFLEAVFQSKRNEIIIHLV